MQIWYNIIRHKLKREKGPLVPR